MSGDEQAPTAGDIVRRHVDALGGRDTILGIRSLKKRGTYTHNGFEYPIVSYHKPRRRHREEIRGLQLWGTRVWEGHTFLRGTSGTGATPHGFDGAPHSCLESTATSGRGSPSVV